MKKLLTILSLFITLSGNAQDSDNSGQWILINKLIDIPALLFGIYLASAFIITLIKLILDHRLKHLMIEKGFSNDVIREILQSNNKNLRLEAIKWVVLFAGIGTGLFIAWFFKPFGLHTIAIMVLAVSVSFYIYYRLVNYFTDK